MRFSLFFIFARSKSKTIIEICEGYREKFIDSVFSNCSFYYKRTTRLIDGFTRLMRN